MTDAATITREIANTAAARLERAIFLANCFTNDDEMAEGIELLRNEVEHARDCIDEQCERLDLDDHAVWAICVVRIDAFIQSGEEHGALLPDGFFNHLGWYRMISNLAR